MTHCTLCNLDAVRANSPVAARDWPGPLTFSAGSTRSFPLLISPPSWVWFTSPG